MTRIAFVAFVALALSACKTPTPAPAGDEAPTRADENLAVPESDEAPPGDAAPTDKWEGVVEIDRSCKSDDDCTPSYRNIDGAGRCCNSCSPIPVNSTTDRAIDIVCTEHREKNGECDIMKKCLAREAVCVDGECELAGDE